MVAQVPYTKWWVRALTDGVVDLNASGEFILHLTTSVHSLSNANEDLADLDNEVSGTNYSTPGAPILSFTAVESGGTTTFDAADTTVAQHAAGFTNARHGHLAHNTGVTSTSALFSYFDMGSDKGNVSGDLIFQWNPSGIFTIAAS